jgi:hypothetical protein
MEQLAGYKYIVAVKLIDESEDKEDKLIQASYAFIVDSTNTDVFFPAYTGFKNSVPVITNTSEGLSIKAILLYNEQEELGDRLMALYKDEALRSNLIEEGKKEYRAQMMPDAEESLWRTIVEAME